MIATADIIRKLLLDLNLGTVNGLWPIYVALMPDAPDQAICVYDTAGALDGRIMRTGEQIEHQGIQVRVRGLVYANVYNKTREIVLGVDAAHRAAVAYSAGEDYTVVNISRTGAPIPLGLSEDDKRRYNFTINAITTITKD